MMIKLGMTWHHRVVVCVITYVPNISGLTDDDCWQLMATGDYYAEIALRIALLLHYFCLYVFSFPVPCELITEEQKIISGHWRFPGHDRHISRCQRRCWSKIRIINISSGRYSTRDILNRPTGLQPSNKAHTRRHSGVDSTVCFARAVM